MGAITPWQIGHEPGPRLSPIHSLVEQVCMISSGFSTAVPPVMVVIIESKCKGVTISGCKKVTVVAPDVVGTSEVINCKQVTFQITGAAPTLQVDKSERTNVHLSKACVAIATLVFTAGSSTTNIHTPKGEDDEIETPIPEQLKSVLQADGSVKSEIVYAGAE
eukprot:gb/GEZN01012743.1/.p1 GENE.gb/GEZN01012743.1/~~gb/GEZN01012743.1/.p1  ORF type:complete len:163 (-),score=21.00 gb/GEZN01012743.1/:114-602(-)